jgi:tetratricopeptide (TPR) repeat protein
LWFVLPALAVALAGAAYYFKVQGNPQIHNERSRELASKGDLPAAIEELRKSVQIEPSSAEVHENLGALLAARGDLNGATAEYREAIRLRPDYAEAHYNLANALMSTGDKEGAKAQYRMVVTSSTPNGLGAFLEPELPFKVIPKEIKVRVSEPGENPIVLTAYVRGHRVEFFRIDMEQTSNELLGPQIGDIFRDRAEHVVWFRCTESLPFTEFMRVMNILRNAGTDAVNLMLLPE